MKIAKRLLILAATVIMLCVISVVASAETYGDLTYYVSNGEAYITDCSTSVTEVEIPAEIDGYPVTKISSFAFEDCEALKSVTIPDSVTSIGYAAFSYCDELKSITIPDSVTSIGDRAFKYCDALKSITIPDSVTSIGDFAFADCTGLTKINWNVSYINKLGKYVFFGAGISGDGIDVVFGNKVKSIPGSLFNSSNRYAIPPKIKNVIISDSVTEIGNCAFWCCDELTSVTIPDSVTKIGECAFAACDSLTSVIIPDSVTSIGIVAFSDCTGLTSVSFGNSLSIIGDSAFSNCENLTSITIPDSVVSIGDHAFYNCTSLTNVNIGDSVTNIGYSAFKNCTSLTSVTIPDSITHIKKSTFIDCNALKDVYFIGTEEEWKNITIDTGNGPIMLATIHYNPKPEYITGDINGDGKVTTADARLVLRIAVGLESLESYSVPLEAIDMNGDGKIATSDARTVLRKAVGLE